MSMRICVIAALVADCGAGVAPGSRDLSGYEADVTAPGYQPEHARIEVPAREVNPEDCCPVTYVPQAQWVHLTPAN